MHSRFSRRSFLKAAGMGPALLPMLEDDLARASCLATGLKRLVVVNWGNGLQQRVSGTGSTFSLPGIMKPLQPHKADLLIPDALFNKTFDDVYNKAGFDNEAHDSPPSLLIAKPMKQNTPAPTASLDYVIGNALRQSAKTPYTVLNLGVLYKNLSCSWQAASVVATPDDDPYHAFDKIFGGLRPGVGMPMMDSVRSVRKSVLDYVQKDITRFSRKLGSEDRLRIDGHLSSIREIENRLAPRLVSDECQFPTLGPKFDVHSSDNYEKVLRAQIDIGVAGLAAGLSQVLTLQATSASSSHYVVSWLGYNATGVIRPGAGGGDVNSHHAIAHINAASKTALDTWFFTQVAYLIDKLKAAKEGTGSVFDNSVTLVTNNMNYGNVHRVKDLPWLLAGTAGGFFKTGRVLPAANASHTQLLIGLCNAFAVSSNGFADPAYGGELPGLRG